MDFLAGSDDFNAVKTNKELTSAPTASFARPEIRVLTLPTACVGLQQKSFNPIVQARTYSRGNKASNSFFLCLTPTAIDVPLGCS